MKNRIKRIFPYFQSKITQFVTRCIARDKVTVKFVARSDDITIYLRVLVFPWRKKVLDRWVFVLEQWVFVLDQWVFVLDQWVFVLDQWVFVLDKQVFVLDHRVFGLRSSFLSQTHLIHNLEFRILVFHNIECRILVFQNVEFKILFFQNLEFRILGVQNVEFRIWAVQNSGSWQSKILNSGFWQTLTLTLSHNSTEITLLLVYLQWILYFLDDSVAIKKQFDGGVRHLQTADLQTCRLADLQTCRLADLQTCRLADCRLADLQTFVTNWKDYKLVLHWK